MGLAASTPGPIPAPVPHQLPLLTETPHHTTTILPAPQWTQPAVLPTPLTQVAPLHQLETHQAVASLHTLLLQKSLRSITSITRSPSVMYDAPRFPHRPQVDEGNTDGLCRLLTGAGAIKLETFLRRCSCLTLPQRHGRRHSWISKRR